MWLFLVSQTANDELDTFDSFVVFANDVEEARRTYPYKTSWEHGDNTVKWLESPEYTGWTKNGCEFDSYNWVNNLEDVKVTPIGEALYGTGQKKGIVCASYNAG